MALSKALMKTTITASMVSIVGTPTDAAVQAKFAEALADALYTILTAQAQVVMAGGGADTGGFSLVLNQGAIT